LISLSNHPFEERKREREIKPIMMMDEETMSEWMGKSIQLMAMD
jgi:hypothetical protein